MKKLVSVIAPVYNEAGVIEKFVARVTAAIAPLETRYDFEIVLVNDGSRDDSLERIKRLASGEPRLRIVDLCRNYGQTAALQAGLDTARGQILITMDADLQHFPEEIPRFIDALEQGFDMVCGWRHQRAEGAIRRWPSRVANLLIRRIARVNIHDFGTTFRAYDAELMKDIRLLGEFHRYIPVLGYVAGARITEIPIENVVRPVGTSNYGIGRTFDVALDLLLLFFLSRYLDRPMRAFGKIAAVAFISGMSILTVLVVTAYIYHIPTVREYSGWFLMSLILILTSIQVLLTGLMAEILVRVHYSQGDRRVYRVRQIWCWEGVPTLRLPATGEGRVAEAAS
jgi:glycosyltransferase involved in cell wall biosynthesis